MKAGEKWTLLTQCQNPRFNFHAYIAVAIPSHDLGSIELVCAVRYQANLHRSLMVKNKPKLHDIDSSFDECIVQVNQIIQANHSKASFSQLLQIDEGRSCM